MQLGFTKRLGIGLVILLTAVCAQTSFAAPPEALNVAVAAFKHGQANDALRAVDSALRANSGSASAWNLQCRIYLAQSRSADAINSCQRAVQLAPANSEYHRWLAHAYGEKASHAKLLAAYQTAKLAHSEFETAVALDGQNRDALSDLGKYYIQAPRVLGGGYDKAEGMAARLARIDPARADELRALIAEAKKDYGAAEQQWRVRIADSKASTENTAQAWMDLGNFYRRRGRWNEMMTALNTGAAADKTHGPALVDGATTLILAHREPGLAAQWLRQYLNGNALSDVAPAFAVHTELGDLLKKQGDEQQANNEFAAARALSTNIVEVAALNPGD